MTHNLYSESLSLIERALNGTLEVDEACFFLSSLERSVDTVVSEAVHAIVHFVTDVDIRKSDKEYDFFLRTELEKYAEQLKELIYLDASNKSS